jgi:hypothetical protein
VAKYASKDVAFFLLDGLSLLGDTTVINDEGKEAVLEDTTPFGVEWPRFEDAKTRKFSLAQEGMFDDATGMLHDALVDPDGGERVLCFCVEGNTAGKRLKASEGIIQVNYERTAAKGVLHRAKAKYAAAGAYEEGKIVAPLIQRSGASGDTKATYIDLATAGALGGSAILQLTDVDLGGGTGIVFTLAHSSDHSAWTTLATFTSRTAIGAQRIEVAAGANSIKRYVAMTWAIAGAPVDPLFTAMLGVYKR